jgi:serine protease Do
MLFTSLALLGARGDEPDLAKAIKVDATPLPPQEKIPLSYASVVEKCLPSVVTVLTVKYASSNDPGTDNPFDLGDKKTPPEPQPQRGSGSGVILTSQGYILTNNHVVEDRDDIRVRLTGEDRDWEARLIGRDPLTDVALLKIEAPNLQPITVGDSTTLRRGDVVLALGSPFGLEQTVTMGIVSATSRMLGFIRNGYEDFIQTDAPINPGNSGGALVDGLGRLVGVNTATYSGGWSPAQGIGFAVPSSLALRVAGDLLRTGHVVRGYMGVQWAEVSEEEALRITGRTDLRPARIVAIEAGTPAEKAGFEGGDIVLSLNGHPTPSLAKARYAVATLLPGSKATFAVLRGKKQHTVEVTLIEVPGEYSKNGAKGPQVEKKPSAEMLKGVEVGSLTDAARVKFKVPSETQGVLVMKAEEDGKPMTRLSPGDVITAVNGEEIKEPESALRTTKDAPHGKSFMLRVWHKGAQGFVMLRKK